MSKDQNNVIDQRVNEEYKYGFITDIESDTLPPGISEETIHFISNFRNLSKIDSKLREMRAIFNHAFLV